MCSSEPFQSKFDDFILSLIEQFIYDLFETNRFFFYSRPFNLNLVDEHGHSKIVPKWLSTSDLCRRCEWSLPNKNNVNVVQSIFLSFLSFSVSFLRIFTLFLLFVIFRLVHGRSNAMKSFFSFTLFSFLFFGRHKNRIKHRKKRKISLTTGSVLDSVLLLFWLLINHEKK